MNLTDFFKKLKKKESFIDKIKRWCKYIKNYSIDNIYYFRKGISNIIKWYKIIWKDYDFGYNDILKIWRFKLEKIANNFEKRYKKAKNINSAYYDELHEQIKWIRICCRLIDKIWGEGEFLNKTYQEEYSAYYKTKYIWQPTKKNLEEAKKLAQSINRDRKIDAVLNDLEYEEIDLESEVELDLLDLEPDKPYTLNAKNVSENFDEYFAENKLSLRKAKIKTGSSDKKVLAMTISEMKHKKAKRLLFKIIEEKIENWID